jgi:hypothetical protein
MNRTGTEIKKREKANDVFITPNALVKIHLDLVKEYVDDGDLILDPFYGTGNYYNQFQTIFDKNNRFDYTEINMGLDFLQYERTPNLIISNPPYSCIDAVLDKSISLNPHTISYLIGLMNLTCKRVEKMNRAGYFISKIYITKVFKWFGMSCIVVFTKKTDKNILEFDRTVWRED